MNAGNIKQVWLLITLYTVTAVVIANPGEYFLNSVIAQLQHNYNPQLPPDTGHRSLDDDLFGTYSRSAEEFQNPEAQESSENSLRQQNHEFDQSQNQIFHQLNALQHQANFIAGNPLNVVTNDKLIQHPLQQPAIIGLQQFNVNGYLNLPPPATPPEVTEPSQEPEPQNNDPHHFAQNEALQPAPIALVPFDPQLIIQQIPDQPIADQQNTGQLHEVLQTNQVPVPTYYFHNPDPAIDGNFIDEPYNQALRPLEDEQLLGIPPGKKIVVGPLFVAMAGFVGIAMIFMSAILFLPKILTPSPEVSSLKGPQELVALTKLAVETIEGNDCTERIACEVGRAMRSMQVGSKPIKVLEVLLPANIAKQLAQIRKAVANEKTCRLIQCRSGQLSDLKSKLVESKIVADLDTIEVATKGGQKQKGKTETPATTKPPKQSTKTPETKPTDKKQQKDVDKKPIKEQQDSKPPQSKDTDKKVAQKKVEEKKPKVKKPNNDTELRKRRMPSGSGGAPKVSRTKLNLKFTKTENL